MKTKLLLLSCLIIVMTSCKKEEDPDPTNANLIVKIKFDSTLPRLDNFGQPAIVPTEHSTQSPDIKTMSAHYIELAPTAYTPLESGEIIYVGEETTAGGAKAVDFSNAAITGNNEIMVVIPIFSIKPGTYEWLRVSLTYQNGDIQFRDSGIDYTGTLASFVGFNTYIGTHQVDQQSVTVNANKLQGYWAFETLGLMFEGDAGATTVPNPLASTSPIPPGSCVVTGEFPGGFTITGEEKSDIILNMNFSTNESFEWYDVNQNGYYEPNDGDYVVDMGLRGLYPTIE